MPSALDTAITLHGRQATTEDVNLPWICLRCVYCHIEDGVAEPRDVRALYENRITCALGLELPCRCRWCRAFTSTGTLQGDW